MTESSKQGQEPRLHDQAERTLERFLTDGGHDTDSLSDDLTRFQIDLLVAAGRLGGASGQDLKRFIADAWGRDEDAINHGRLYPNLITLEEAGLVECGTLDRRTNEYTLSDAGQCVLDDRAVWLTLPETG